MSGALCAATATIVLGTSFAASRLLTDYPFVLSQGVRYATGALVLVLVMLLRRERWPRLSVPDAARLAVLAATGLVGFNLCLLAALRESDPAAVGVVVGCVPLILSFAGPLMQWRLPSTRLLLAAGLVSGGAAAVQGGGSSTLAGLGWALGTLACEAAFSLLAVPLLPRLGPLAVSLYSSLLAGIALLVTAVLLNGAAAFRMPQAAEAWAIGYLGVVVTAGAFIAWYAAIVRLGVERAGLVVGLVPIAALVSGALLGQAVLSPLRVVGVFTAAVGVSIGLSVPRRVTSRPAGRRVRGDTETQHLPN